MSNVGQALTAVVGAAIGFAIGGPTGAAYGFQAGLLGGSLLFPTKLPEQFGPRLEDLNTTTATLGNPVAITWGTFPVPGQVLGLGCVEEVATTEEVGGKGAPEQTVTTYTYFQTLALGLSEGPICGILRIWENGEPKYDIRPQQADESAQAYSARLDASTQYSETFTLYLGDETQLPDPALEIIYGVDNVPGFRGLAYIVYPDRQLRDDQARRHPQFRFEIYRGASVPRGLTLPTLLTGTLTHFDLTILAVDWRGGRFFTFDTTGDGLSTSPDIVGIRAFRLRSNTEFLQRSWEDLGYTTPGGGEPTSYQATVGESGYLYACVGVDAGIVALIRFDPETLDTLASRTTGSGGDAWATAITTTASGFEFVVASNILGTHVKVYRGDTMIEVTDYGVSRYGVQLVRGAEAGIVWGVNFAAAPTTPTAGPEILKITCTYSSGSPSATVESIGFVDLADMDPTWINTSGLNGVAFDKSDGTLIFHAQGYNGSFDTAAEFKVDPVTLAVIWKNTTDHEDVSVTFAASSRVQSGRYATVAADFGSVAHMVTGSGEVTIEDWSDLLGGSLTGEESYDAVSNCLLTYLGGTGPVLLCFDVCSPEGIILGDIVADVCERAGLGLADFDVSDLTQTVHGYGVMRSMSGRNMIEPLRPVGAFDAVESDGLIKFPVRGGAIAVTLDVDNLSAHAPGGQAPPAVETVQAQDVELPLQVRVRYIAPSRDYEPGEQLSPTRFTTEAENVVDLDVPVALDDTQAAQIAEIVWADAWAARWTHKLSVDSQHLALDPTDVIGIPIEGRVYRARIVSIDDEGGMIRRIDAVRDDDGAYVSQAVADAPRIPPASLVIYSQTTLVLMDLPPLRDQDNDAGFYAAAGRSTAGYTWTGAVVHRSIDGGTTWSAVASVASEAYIGTLIADVPAGITTVWDLENEIIVNLSSGALESRLEDAVIGGANAAAIGAHGRWEIIQFLNVEAISDTQYRLTGLLRGRRGTEHNVGLTVSGDQFVLISGPGIFRVPMQTTEIGQERQYRAATLGTIASSAEVQAFTGAGEALMPFSPVHITGARDGSSNLTIAWVRRGRLGEELPDGADIPLSEATESYEVDVMDGVTVARTLTATVQSVAYSAAQQTTDFGAPQSSVVARVYQLSATVGRGTAGEATV